MKIKSISLKSFKRFTELRIQNIPETAKLIVMAGPNGCGKSSIFDALKSWHRHWKGAGHNWDARYHHKYGIKEILDVNRAIKVDFHGTVPTDAEMKKKALYVRTAYRNDPQFRLNRLDRMTSPLDEERFDKLIQNDIAVSSNYQRLVSKAFRELFVTLEENTTIGEFRQQVIGDIKSSLQRVFPDLVLNDLGDPLDEGTFFFDKGVSQKFEYPNLSGGEKAAFDIILDLVVKRRDFNDTVFCIDEPDLHMNTRLQRDLLQEMNIRSDRGRVFTIDK